MTKFNQSLALPGGGTGSGAAPWIATPTDYSMIVAVKCVTAGTPTAAASFIVLYSLDGGTSGDQIMTINVPLSVGTYFWTIDLPDAATAVAAVITAATGGTSTFTMNLGSLRG
jgi:hypothetical protein